MTTVLPPLDTIEAICRAVQDQRDHLSELDAALGDGDHGLSMAKTFRAVEEQLPSLAGMDLPLVLQVIGMTVLGTVGGAMGPLFGSAFLEAARIARESNVASVNAVDGETLVRMIEAAQDGVAARGGAKPGQKTMLDALDAATSSARAAIDTDPEARVDTVLAAAADGAAAGAAATRGMLATIGRASRLGERTIGHADPGATSVAIILRAAADHLSSRR